MHRRCASWQHGHGRQPLRVSHRGAAPSQFLLQRGAAPWTYHSPAVSSCLQKLLVLCNKCEAMRWDGVHSTWEEPRGRRLLWTSWHRASWLPLKTMTSCQSLSTIKRHLTNLTGKEDGRMEPSGHHAFKEISRAAWQSS